MNQQFSFAARRRGLKLHKRLSNMTDEERKEWYEAECLKIIQDSGDKALERQLFKAKTDKALSQRKAPEAKKSYITGQFQDLNRRFQAASKRLRELCGKEDGEQ